MAADAPTPPGYGPVSVRGSFPQRAAVCIAYPGDIHSVDKAVDTLGGLDAVAAAARDKSFIKCRLRPADPYAHPIYAEMRSTTSFLVRMRRRPATEMGEPSSWDASVVARVPQTYRFRGMADLQYIVRGHKATLSEELQKAKASKDTLDDAAQKDKGHRILEIPPTLFSTIDLPTAYGKSWEGKKLQKRKAVDLDKPYEGLVTVEYRANMTIPQRVERSEEALTEASESTLAELHRLFDRRPIWTRMALVKHLEHRDSESHLKHLLPLVAYYFINGPWSRCYVKMGFDPRRSPDSRIYQVVDIRLGVERNKPRPAGAVPAGGGIIGAATAAVTAVSQAATATAGNVSQLVPRKSDISQLGAPLRIRQQEHQRASKHRAGDADAPQPGEASQVSGVPQQRQFHVQLCDVKDERLQQVIHEAQRALGEAALCDAKNGWYDADVMDQLRRELKKGYMEMLRSAGGEGSKAAADDDVQLLDDSAVGALVNTVDEEDQRTALLRQLQALPPTQAEGGGLADGDNFMVNFGDDDEDED